MVPAERVEQPVGVVRQRDENLRAVALDATREMIHHLVVIIDVLQRLHAENDFGAIFVEHLAERGENLPAIIPKLVDQEEAASMLGVGLSNFKKLEREGAFSFKRKMVGTSVRYRNTDVISYILASDDSSLSKPTSD